MIKSNREKKDWGSMYKKGEADFSMEYLAIHELKKYENGRYSIGEPCAVPIEEIIEKHIIGGEVVKRLLCKEEAWVLENSRNGKHTKIGIGICTNLDAVLYYMIFIQNSCNYLCLSRGW